MRFITKIAENELAVKHIFDNIRNIGLCTLVFGAAGWKMQNIGNGWLHYFDLSLVWFLVITGYLLLWINFHNGLFKIKSTHLPIWIKGILGGLYAAVGIQVFFSILAERFGI